MAGEPTGTCRPCVNGAAFAILAAAFGSAIAGGQCRYEVTIIQGPTHPVWGLPVTVATGLNNLGQVVGYYSYLGEDDRGFVWTAQDGFQGLLTPPGASAFKPWDINDSGIIVGTAEVPGAGYRGFVYQDGSYTYLPPLPGGLWSEALAINNLGHVVGYRSVGPGVNPFNAFLWIDGVFTDFGLMDSLQTIATEINDLGQVVGYRGYLAATDETFFWNQGQLTFLGPVPGAVTSAPGGINNSGHVVCTGILLRQDPPTPRSRVARWEAGKWTPLLFLPDSEVGGAGDVNDFEDAVGSCIVANEPRALLWRGGAVYELASLVEYMPNVSLERGKRVTSHGQVLVEGSAASNTAGFLLSPALPFESDFDSDGDIDLSDLTQLLSGFGCTIGNCPGDTDSDGDTDLVDLSRLLADFGRTCP